MVKAMATWTRDLDEDPRCFMSFLSPESVIEDRNEFALRDPVHGVESLVAL
jgi:hypothetical protein